ncbi:hypothetical protein HDV05_008103 [Chytridiales sp. JEL 0842]|nr:hypothetical protein HDV05_008103 [Chytridiales sp. JEL 0842]
MLPTILTLTYLLWTLFTASMVFIALTPLPKFVSAHHRFFVMVIGTLVTEAPHLLLVIKFAVLAWFKYYAGIFESSAGALAEGSGADGKALNGTLTGVASAESAEKSLWSEWVYMADVSVFLAYWAILLQLFYAKLIVDTATAVYRNAESTEAPGVNTAAFWFRIMNPFWTGRNIQVHKDIIYSTEEELKYAGPGMDEFMSLDVFHHPAYPRQRPVMVYIHGGSWQTGSKEYPIPPFVRYLARQKWVVVSVNYRMAPTSPYPTHLQDVKRAIRWVHHNIHHYGGDKQFIFVSGTQSGGHLAAMTALTANDPFYQKGFEELDTSVQGCVVVNGILDVCDYKGIWGRNGKFPSWFARRIAGLSGGIGIENSSKVDKDSELTASPTDEKAPSSMPVVEAPKVSKKPSKKEKKPVVFGTEEEMDFLRMSSPILLLKYLEMEKRKSTALNTGAAPVLTSPKTEKKNPLSALSVFRGRMRDRAFSQSSAGLMMEKIVTASPKEGSDSTKPSVVVPADQLPPFLIFHGSVDSLVPVSHVRDFVSTFKKVTKSIITYIEFPTANHYYNVFGARSHYMAYGIERFLRSTYEDRRKRRMKLD